MAKPLDLDEQKKRSQIAFSEQIVMAYNAWLYYGRDQRKLVKERWPDLGWYPSITAETCHEQIVHAYPIKPTHNQKK